ncbi:AEC family transporter [Piscinibacter sakaiensis]|uniref:Auxin Efflux Carrier n=1 Tax=Piscinibacter sakaiensis TaxID=1547922 RepID=A0A0K8NXJ4_PISS1|nr:AEC family transporter [Piscinibacter sakaiensis]GAP35019.1 auxin Efflux Carrier [Piscinibacter sakaiensis]
MPPIVSVTLPFFGLVLCGYLAARQGALPASAIPGLNAFVLFFALPCMLFRFGQQLPPERLFDPVLAGIYLAAALLMVALSIALTWARSPGAAGVSLRDAGFGALVAAFPNTGFMGVPLLVALIGPAAAGPAIATILIDLIITSTLCIALAEALPRERAGDDGWHEGGGAGGARAAALRSLRGALANPLPWAILLGAAASVAGVGLPGAAGDIVRMLADAASPVALFTIGAVLWRAGAHAHGRTPPGRYLPVAALKLLLHPLLVLALGILARAAGAEVSAFGLTVIVLVAALPSASNVSMLAERYGADNGRIARIILASTVAAFVTFTGAAALFVPGG